MVETSAGPHEADVLLTACGQLSVPAVPPIPGLDTFAGPAFHTAQWRHDVDLAGKRVAVVGTGCSSIQVVPAIQPDVAQVDVYQRSPGWTLPKMDFPYKERTKRLFERFPVLQRLDRQAIFWFQELAAAGMTRQWMLPPFRAIANRQITKAIADPLLRAKVTPPDEIGCKRIMLTDDWYPTLTKPNVELVTDRIAEVTPTGIRTEDGAERPADVLVLATGFKTPWLRRADGDRRRERTHARGGMGRRAARVPGDERPGLSQHVPAVRAEHERRLGLGDPRDRIRAWGT